MTDSEQPKKQTGTIVYTTDFLKHRNRLQQVRQSLHDISLGCDDLAEAIGGILDDLPEPPVDSADLPP